LRDGLLRCWMAGAYRMPRLCRCSKRWEFGRDSIEQGAADEAESFVFGRHEAQVPVCACLPMKTRVRDIITAIVAPTLTRTDGPVLPRDAEHRLEVMKRLITLFLRQNRGFYLDSTQDVSHGLGGSG